MSLERPRPKPVRPQPLEDRDKVLQRARGRVVELGVIFMLLLLAVGAQGVRNIADPDPRTIYYASQTRYQDKSIEGIRGRILAVDGTVLSRSARAPTIAIDAVACREVLKARVLKETFPGRTLVQEVLGQEGAEGEGDEADGWVQRLRAWLRPAKKPDLTLAEVMPYLDVKIHEFAGQLAAVLSRDPEEIERIIRSGSRFQKLVNRAHPSLVSALTRGGFLRVGVVVHMDRRRFYPEGTMASQLVGMVDDSGRGVFGLERSLDHDLAGRTANVTEQIFTSARESQGLPSTTNYDGRDVVLTIEPSIQRALEHALRETVDKHQAIRGGAVAVEVSTGRILAIGSYPAFSQMHYEGTGDASQLSPAQSAVEPGSVFKPITYALALSAGVLTPDTVFKTHSPFRVADRFITDTHPHDQLTSQEIIKVSSNIGAAQMGARVGADRMMQGLKAFGIGELSGLEIPFEVRGLRHPRSGVGPVELATISYGHGATASPLQLALAYAAFGNKGVRMRPWLIDHIKTSDGQVVSEGKPVEAAHVVSETVAAQVLAALEDVTGSEGTGTRARVPGYRVGGKTGTAEKVKSGGYTNRAHYANFVGVGPLPDVRFAVAVFIDEPRAGGHFGGEVAGPAFAEIMKALFDRYEIPPDQPVRPAVVAPTVKAVPAREDVVFAWGGDAWRMADLRGLSLRQALVSLADTGARVQIEGEGVVSAQMPAPQSPLRPGDAVTLVLR